MSKIFSIFGGGGGGSNDAPQMAPPPPPPPAQTDDGKASAEKAATDERVRRSGAGRASTILTSPSGLEDNDPEIIKKKLTGSA